MNVVGKNGTGQKPSFGFREGLPRIEHKDHPVGSGDEFFRELSAKSIGIVYPGSIDQDDAMLKNRQG